MIQRSTEAAANLAAAEVRRLSDMIEQMEVKVDAIEGDDFNVQFTLSLTKVNRQKMA